MQYVQNAQIYGKKHHHNMQIIIPMTGYGSRFKEAGYTNLKPFIQVQGKPMIEWVVNMFPGDEHNITFICRQEHLDTLNYMKPELNRIAPKANIFSIKDWEKKGPVADVLKASDLINDDVPCLISYCDFYMHWDYAGFKKDVIERECAGSVPCYSDFHPNLIPKSNLYASCNVDRDENLIEIKEKFSWETDKFKARHSPGIYYFKNGAILKKYCRKMIDKNHHINGEYYASLPYNEMIKDGLKVWCPVNVKKFCQWGTPKDLKEYLFWTNTVKGFNK